MIFHGKVLVYQWVTQFFGCSFHFWIHDAGLSGPAASPSQPPALPVSFRPEQLRPGRLPTQMMIYPWIYGMWGIMQYIYICVITYMQ